MDDQRWRQIEGVYLAALDAPDRAALLADSCAGDPELQRAVELLLSQEPSTVSLLGRLALDSVGAAFSSTNRLLLEPDSTLGRYRIVELIGSGGSSDVYKAYDTQLDRFVALKLFAGTRITEEFRRRFARESRAAASLNHPNIATVYEIGETANAWFIAMEYVDGATLRQVFGDATCSLRQRISYLAQAASGVARAHANGLAHCDLKPDNIMVTRDGLVKVLDFGLARIAGTFDATGPHFEGTVGYMSPEQAAGQPIDTGSDVFSFGCILFEAVTGNLPFPPGERWLHTLMHAATPPLRPAPSGMPDGLEALIDDCLIKDAARRPSSLEEVSRRLHAVLARKPRPNEWVVAAMVFVAVGLSALTYWAWPAQPLPGSVAVIPFVSAAATPEAR
jgi:serine/threonine protein kinase